MEPASDEATERASSSRYEPDMDELREKGRGGASKRPPGEPGATP